MATLVEQTLASLAAHGDTDDVVSAVWHAAKLGNSELLAALLRGPAVDVVGDEVRQQLLFSCCRAGNVYCVETLTAAKVDVRAADALGDSALHVAAREGFDAIVKHLVARGADANCRNLSQLTPLMVAVLESNVECVEQLLRDRKVDVNAACVDAGGRTALHFAAERGNEEIICHLLARDDVNRTASTFLGHEPAHLAPSSDIAALLSLSPAMASAALQGVGAGTGSNAPLSSSTTGAASSSADDAPTSARSSSSASSASTSSSSSSSPSSPSSSRLPPSPLRGASSPHSALSPRGGAGSSARFAPGDSLLVDDAAWSTAAVPGGTARDAVDNGFLYLQLPCAQLVNVHAPMRNIAVDVVNLKSLDPLLSPRSAAAAHKRGGSDAATTSAALGGGSLMAALDASASTGSMSGAGTGGTGGSGGGGGTGGGSSGSSGSGGGVLGGGSDSALSPSTSADGLAQSLSAPAQGTSRKASITKNIGVGKLSDKSKNWRHSVLGGPEVLGKKEKKEKDKK